MSGPIVRKYGFPNFDKIFGPKPVLHGADDGPKAEDAEAREAGPAPRAEGGPQEGKSAGEGGPSR